ncbi:10499_t:CDS:2, partial [Gigaspora margarita]
NSGRGNYKQFQYQKDVCHINKGKKLFYEVGTTGVQKRARHLKLLRKQALKKESHQESVDRELKEEQIDIEWDCLSNAIQEAANKHIPWSKAKKMEFSCKKVIPKCKYHKELKLLHKICKYKKEKGINKISHSECSRFNIQIKQINEKNMMEIPPLLSAWNLVNVDELQK